MGSPLAPLLGNIFMGFYKSKWLNEYNLNKTKFYLRYVDGILAAFEKEQDSFISILTLNTRQKNELTSASLSLMYSSRVSVIKISHFKHSTNRPIRDCS